MALRGRIDNTDRLGRTIQRVAERSTDDPNYRTRRVLSSGLPTFEPTDFANRQIVAKDFRTALHVGDSAAGVRFTSSGIEGYNSSINKTIDIKTDGSGTLGIGATQISWGTTGTVDIPGGAIDPGTIDELQLADEAVTNAKIAVAAIQGDVIAAAAITETKIDDDSISTAKLKASAVTAAKIAAGTITATEIATDAIVAAKIQAGAVTSAKIASSAIETDKLAANAVTAAKINVSTLSAISANIGSVTAGTITGATIRSASSGSRVEIDSGGINIVGTLGSLVEFWPSGTIGSGDRYAIYGTADNLEIEGTVNLTSPLEVDWIEPGSTAGTINIGHTVFGTDGTSVRIHNSAGSNRIGFFAAAAQTKQTISGARDDPEGALANLLSALSTIGLFNNSTTAT